MCICFPGRFGQSNRNLLCAILVDFYGNVNANSCKFIFWTYLHRSCSSMISLMVNSLPFRCSRNIHILSPFFPRRSHIYANGSPRESTNTAFRTIDFSTSEKISNSIQKPLLFPFPGFTINLQYSPSDKTTFHTCFPHV